MSVRIAIITVIVVGALAWGRTAAASPVAYLESVELYGDADPDAARAFVRRVIEAAGYRVHIAAASSQPCRDEACSTNRAQATGAVVVMRAVVLGLAGEISVTFVIVDVATQRSSVHTRGAVDLGATDATLAGLLRPPLPAAAPGSKRTNVAAIVLTGAAVVLLVGGSGAIIEARSRRETFFAEHVDAMGRVFGISRDQAAAHEATTRRWQLLGGALLVGAAAAGAGATYLFVTGDESAPSGVGVGTRRTF